MSRPVTLLLLLCLFFVLTTCSSKREKKIWGSGLLEATEVTVSSQSQGQLLELRVNESDEIQQSDTLAVIDMSKLQLRCQQLWAMQKELALNIQNAEHTIEQAQNNYTNVEKMYERVKALFEKKSTTRQQLDDVETRYKLAKTQLASAQTAYQAIKAKKTQLTAQLALLDSQIADGVVISPINGVVLEKYIEPGEVVSFGVPLLLLADLRNLWVKVYVAENQIGKIKLAAFAQLKVDSFPQRTFEGRIVWISPKAEFTPKNVQTQEARASLVYAVKVQVSNPDGLLKIGMPVDVILE